MVKVKIQDDSYNIMEHLFSDCTAAGKFMDIVLNTAVKEVTFTVAVVELADIMTPEPPAPQEEPVDTF